MNNTVFIDMVEQQWVVHWLGVPYLVESSYRGRFFNVLDINEQPIEYMLESTILYKFFKMKLNVRTLEEKCKHENIERHDGLDECMDCGARNY